MTPTLPRPSGGGPWGGWPPVIPAGQPNVTLTSGFDALGDRTSLSDSLASIGLETLSYDSADRLTTITTSYGGTSGPQVVFGYDAANQLTSLSRTIGGSGTAVNTTMSYDNADRVTTITHQVGGGSILATYIYGYDNANRLTSEQNGEGTVTYGYDNANELTSASGSRTESYSYDSGGNRNSTGYTTQTGNELTASPGYTYTYDNEGDLSAETSTSTHVVTSFTYDYRNRLTSVTTGGTVVATYTYDGLDRRIGADDNGAQIWTVYDGSNPYADFNGSGSLLVRRLYGPAIDQLLARTDSGGTSAWYLSDRLGTVRDIADSSGSVIDHISYSSFGSVLPESSPANGDRFKFTGREYDATSGLYYDRARYYDPAAGRFVSRDPIAFLGGDPNLYRYAGNQPTDRMDPTGLDSNDGEGARPKGTDECLQQAAKLQRRILEQEALKANIDARLTAIEKERKEVTAFEQRVREHPIYDEATTNWMIQQRRDNLNTERMLLLQQLRATDVERARLEAARDKVKEHLPPGTVIRVPFWLPFIPEPLLLLPR
jgi:RHS repeat-associated protein